MEYERKIPGQEIEKIISQKKELIPKIFALEQLVNKMERKIKDSKITPDEEVSSLTKAKEDLEERSEKMQQLGKEQARWENCDEWVRQVKSRYEAAVKDVQSETEAKVLAEEHVEETEKKLNQADEEKKEFNQHREEEDMIKKNEFKEELEQKRRNKLEEKLNLVREASAKTQSDISNLLEKAKQVEKSIKLEEEKFVSQQNILAGETQDLEAEIEKELEKQRDLERIYEAEVELELD